MELAINDLLNHRNARKVGKSIPFLSPRGIQSVSRQALEAIQHLHAQGITHRDLKPANVLVTEWDPKTDLPTIKLADFGLASLRSEHATFCGTEGWLAPEVERAYARFKKFAEQHDRGMKAPACHYTNSVDIWALGKILKELLCDIPASRCIRGKNIATSKEPAMRLIKKMMGKVPKTRPTASECLDDPWIVRNDTSSGLFATKRNVSPVTTPEAVHPFKKVICSTYVGAEEGSTQTLKSAMWPGEISESSHWLISLSETRDKSKPSSRYHSDINHLTMKPWAEGKFSVIAHCRDGQLIHVSLMSCNHATADASHVLSDLVTSRETSIQALARKLLAALKMERYGNDDEVMRQEFERLNITTLQIHQSAGSSVSIGDVRDDRDLSSSYLNSSDAHAPGADEYH